MSNVNRRAFLASAAVATAAASRMSGAESDRLRVGFIGVGGRGTALLRNFLEAKLGDVVAVCDIKPEHAKRAATLITGAGQKEPVLTEDWKKLLEAKDVQAVVSALPEANNLSSGLILRSFTLPVCPARVNNGSPVFASHFLMVLS